MRLRGATRLRGLPRVIVGSLRTSPASNVRPRSSDSRGRTLSISGCGDAREEVEQDHPGDDEHYPDYASQAQRLAPEQYPGHHGAGGAEPGPDGVGDAKRYLLEGQRQQVERE